MTQIRDANFDPFASANLYRRLIGGTYSLTCAEHS